MLFNGDASIKFGGATIYGYTTHADINTATSAGDWSDGTNGTKYAALTVQRLIAALITDGFDGPYALYLNQAQYGELLGAVDTTTYSRTTLQYLMDSFPMVKTIKMSAKVTAGTAVMVQLTSDVVDLSVGQAPTAIQWSENGGLSTKFVVFAAWAPRIKSDAEGHCGVCTVTGI
jgi:uncharacterized linocin/CFP29 family protein